MVTQTIALAFSFGGANSGKVASMAVPFTGWITRVVPVVQSLSTVPPGRYHCSLFLAPQTQVANIAPSGQNDTLWRGYVYGGLLSSSSIGVNAASQPNLKVFQGEQIWVLGFAGTKGLTTDLFVFNVTVDTDPPAGGSLIYDQPPFTGPGDVFSATIATPGAGANPAVQTIPSFVRREWRGFTAQLVTGAAVANRSLKGVVNDTTNDTAGTDSGAAHAASLTINYYFAKGGGNSSSTLLGSMGQPLPQGQYPNGFVFKIVVDSIQAADQVNPVAGSSNISISYEEWAGGPF